MLDRARGEMLRRSPRRGCLPRLESLEDRALLASLAPIAPVSIPTTLGLQLPMDGSGAGTDAQSFTVTSSNPDITATVAQGQFLTLTVRHTPAQGQPTDPAFAGKLTFQLFGDLTPNTVNEIISLVNSGFYNNNPSTAGTFNRIASGFPTTSDFILQGGSITGTTAGNSNQPGTPFVDEFNPQLAFTSGQGQLAMANSGPDTNDTQFFITTSANPTIDSYRSLDFGYTIFAQLVADPQNILPLMRQVAVNPSTNQPLSPVSFLTDLSSTNPNGVIHINATKAAAGETATLKVTASDGRTSTTASQTFQVNVIPNNNSSGKPVIEKPYLQQLPYPTTVINPTGNQPVVVYQQSVGLNQTNIFQVQGYAATPNDPLTYTIQGGVSTGTTGEQTFTPVQNVQSAKVNSSGVVTVVPTAGFSGTIQFLVGVRDNTNRAGIDPATGQQYALDSPPNYDWHKVQLTVNASPTPVPLTPIATSFTTSATAGNVETIQLQAQSANPATTTGLTYALASQPAHGVITAFNAATGTLNYTPNPNFTGSDSFQFQVTDHGTGNATPTSPPATVTINVGLANTGAVRVIGNVLVVTPVPRRDKGTNTIVISENQNSADGSGGTIVVTINGIIDANQPLVSSLNQIIVFGSKANDRITIDPSVDPTLPITLDGGHGGVNVLQAGSGFTLEHGWFGHNTLIGGAGTNELVGRAGHVRFKPTSATDRIFAGVPRPGVHHLVHHRNSIFSTYHINPPGGTFYQLVNGRLVPTTPGHSGTKAAAIHAHAVARHIITKPKKY